MKKAIDGFVLVVGVALAASGAWWMWTGWDVVQVERGWASLISGAVMLSGGLVVFALGWVAMRLSGLSTFAPHVSAIERAEEFAPPRSPLAGATTLGAAAAATAAAAAVAVESAVHRETHVETPEAQPEPEPSGARPPSLPSASELLKLGENRRAELDEQPDEETSESDVAADVREPLHEPMREWPKAPQLPPFVPEAPAPPPLAAELEPDPEPTPVKVELPPLPEPPPLPPLPPLATVPPPAAPPAPTGDPDAPVYDDWLEETERSLDRELGRASLPKETGHDVGEARIEPPAPEPAVVGRYSSGDTNYVMFADGSIEAQTPEGAMRFASLVELRRFVEQRH